MLLVELLKYFAKPQASWSKIEGNCNTSGLLAKLRIGNPKYFLVDLVATCKCFNGFAMFNQT